MNIIESKTVTPEFIATEIIETTSHGWGVACEGGCGKNMWVSRRQWQPTNYAKPNGDHIETVFTAPSRRTCALCGIPNGVKPIKTAVNKNIDVLTFGFYEMKTYKIDGKVQKIVICENGVEIKTFKSVGWANRAWGKIKSDAITAHFANKN